MAMPLRNTDDVLAHDEASRALGIAVPATDGVQAWDAMRATGPPDAVSETDLDPNSWRPTGRDLEWLELRFGKPIPARSVQIHQPVGPGALTKVVGLTSDGDKIVLWREDKGAITAMLEIKVTSPSTFQSIHLEIHPLIAGWNHIDTVGLTDKSGHTHWPVSAEAGKSRR